MNLIGRLLARFNPPPADPTAGMTQRAVYDFGYQNGYAWGEVVGRKQAFDDIMQYLAVTGRGIEELSAADVAVVRAKSTH